MPTVNEELAAFDKAASDYVAAPNSHAPIRTMMELALEGRSPALRRWAAIWLKDKCAITIAFDEEPDHAASPEAGSLLQ